MGYKFFDKKYLVMLDDKDIIGKKVLYADHLDMLICDVENGDTSRTGILDAIIADCSFPFYINSSRWGLCYYDPSYEARVAYSQGKQIQVRLPNTDEWLDTKEPAWAEASEYRVKPETPETRRFTNRELAKWLADNKGQYTAYANKSYLSTGYQYPLGDDDESVHECIRIREWDSDEWHEPVMEVKE